MNEIVRPVRIQLSRRKGWRMPPNTVKVCRPTKWGNPHPVGTPCPICEGETHTSKEAVDRYEADVINACAITIAQARAELRGKNLACWCSLDEACHADVLLEVANAAVEARRNAVASDGLLADESKGETR